MKQLIFIIIVFAWFNHLFADELTQTIRGRIVDSETGIPLVGATVIITDVSPVKGAVCDKDGHFKIEGVQVGRRSIKATYIGYRPVFIDNVILTSSKELVLDIKMEEFVSKTSDVVVIGNDKTRAINESAMVSARTFTVEETQRYAGAIQDPARMAANYAGVIASNDERNDIVVRGNSPIGMLWRLEGIDIPNPNHFSFNGNTGGGISILNNNNLANSDFYTGAFPSQIGNAISGAFDLQLRNGNNEQREYSAQIGLLGVEIGLEGPFGGSSKSSYIANYRYSTLQAIDALGAVMDELPGIPKYQDLCFKLDFPNTFGLGKFSLFGIGGISEMSIKYKDKNDDIYDNYDENPWVNSYDKHKMGVVGLSHLIFITAQSFLKTTFAVTGSGNRLIIDTIRADNKTYLLQDYSDNEIDYIFSTNYNYKLDAANSVEAGFMSSTAQYKFVDSIYNPDIERFMVHNNMEGSSTLFQGFAEFRHKFSDFIETSTGIHYQHFTLNDASSLEPRLGFKWNFLPDQSLNFGGGIYSRTQPYDFYLFETELSDGRLVRTNENLDYTKSVQVVLGYNNNFAENFRLKIETYYQNLYNIPVESLPSSFSMVNVGTDSDFPYVDSLVNKGAAYNYGIELTIEKFFSSNYYFLITASVFNSRYKGSDGIERNTVFNANYSFNALGGVEILTGESSRLSVDLKICAVGGRRYIPIDIEASNAVGYPVYENNKAFDYRYNDYFRTDMKIGYRIDTKSCTHFIAFDARNLFDTKNISKVIYDPANQKLGTMYQFFFTPNLYYRIQF